MTRWVRFVLTVIRSMFKPRLRADRESRLTFRVWPTDADLSLMNHASYLTIMEQGRVDFILRTGIMRLMLRHRWSALLGSITVQYRSPLRRFQRFQLRTRVVCWDDQWVFLEHQISRESRIVAGGLAKIAFLGRDGRIAPVEALRAFGVTIASPPVAAVVRSIQEGERLLYERVQQWPALEWSLDSLSP
jgi:acyl-CoA thioesterase FadM